MFRLSLIQAMIIASTSLAPPAMAHSWYPSECCQQIDCAPVDSVTRLVPKGGGPAELLVTSKHGTVIIPAGFPVRESRDGRIHICMGYGPFGSRELLCLFMPPST